jgi:hypothetical protein
MLVIIMFIDYYYYYYLFTFCKLLNDTFIVASDDWMIRNYKLRRV